MKLFQSISPSFKRAFGLIITLSLVTNAQAQNPNPSMEDISYAFGVLFAKNLQDQGLESISTSEMAEGLSSQMKGDARLTPEQANEIVGEFMQAKQMEASAGYDAECKSFLAENAEKSGIEITASGLQYKHETVGEGDSPTAASTVTVHYRGTLIDGTEFDSSYSRGEPISFPLGNVIAGWTEGLQLMKPGGKTTFFIPQNLAYGANPNPNGPIPPLAALVFEVELISVQ
jgi:FKBP-type peptidyl-prolyl cis-trans isomerase